jgi:phosphate transport system permease protein
LWQDLCLVFLTWGFGLVGLMLPVAIVSFLLYQGAGAISWDLLWQIPKAFPLGSSGGIRPAIEGSIALIALGLMVSLPLGLGAAVYLTEYSRSERVKRAVVFFSSCLAGVPAIVYGLCGFAFLVVALSMKVSLMAGALTLSMVMLPIILIGAFETVLAVEGKYRDAALSLGVSRFHAFRKNVWPKARPGIIAAVVLTAGHAFGSAAPVLLTASIVLSKGGLELSSPVMTLPTHLYYLVSEASSLEQAYATALILVVILLSANVTVILAKGAREG